MEFKICTKYQIKEKKMQIAFSEKINRFLFYFY